MHLGLQEVNLLNMIKLDTSPWFSKVMANAQSAMETQCSKHESHCLRGTAGGCG